MRIDAHQHFWRYDPDRDGWITSEMAVLRQDFLPGELEELLLGCGMEGSVAVQADQSEEETVFLLEMAEAHPSILGVVGWVDLLAPELARRLEHFSGWDRFRGVRHIAQAEADDFLAREEVVQGIGTLREFNLTFDLLVYPRQLPAALSLVRALPDQPFVVDHMAKPLIADGVLDPWATQMREMAKHTNVWCKVSGLVTEGKWTAWRPEDFRPYLDVIFEAFGADRLMFGSDWPVCLLAAEYAQVVELMESYAEPFSEAERTGFFGENATRFYGLNS